VVIDGADRTVLSHNRIQQHGFAGLTLVNFCLGSPQACVPGLPIDPYPDGNRVVRNRFIDNNVNVVFFPGTGQDNCFAGNRPSPLQSGATLPSCP
jgi:hypothetical protein